MQDYQGIELLGAYTTRTVTESVTFSNDAIVPVEMSKWQLQSVLVDVISNGNSISKTYQTRNRMVPANDSLGQFLLDYTEMSRRLLKFLGNA